MDVAKVVVKSDRFETIMFPFNFITREAAEELLPLCREHDVGFIAMKPLAGGMLDNATRLQIPVPVPGYPHIPGIEKVAEIEEIVDIPRSARMTAAESKRCRPERRAGHAVLPPLRLLPALHPGDTYLHGHVLPFVRQAHAAGVVPEEPLDRPGHGPRRRLLRVRRVRDALPLSPAPEELGTRFCRRCEYCQPCTQQIPISLVMTFPSFVKRLPPDWYLKNTWIAPAMARAADCTECGECETRCPYHLPIREMVAENYRIFDEIRKQHEGLCCHCEGVATWQSPLREEIQAH